MIFCEKCGKEVDTLAKRRHRCRKVPPEPVKDTHIQLVFWSMRAQREFDHVGNGK